MKRTVDARRAGTALIVALVALVASDPVWANAAAPLFAPGDRGGAFIAGPTTLVVEHEEVEFRCGELGCEFEAVYHVQNPGDAREEVIGAFYGIETDHFATTADGVDARRPLTPEQLRAVDGAVGAFDRALAQDTKIVREGFGLGVDPHARATLVFSGRIRPVSGTSGSVVGYMGFPPLETRHPWLGTHARRDQTARYAYALSPIRAWAGSPEIDVTVRCPDARFWESDQEGWTARSEDGGFVARRTIAAREASTLSFTIVDEPGNLVLNGGPFVGIGDRVDAGQVRARFGYEIAVPWWVIWSASAETSFNGTTTLIALGEVASPDVFVIIPSVGLGAGVPVRDPVRRGDARRRQGAGHAVLPSALDRVAGRRVSGRRVERHLASRALCAGVVLIQAVRATHSRGSFSPGASIRACGDDRPSAHSRHAVTSIPAAARLAPAIRPRSRLAIAPPETAADRDRDRTRSPVAHLLLGRLLHGHSIGSRCGALVGAFVGPRRATGRRALRPDLRRCSHLSATRRPRDKARRDGGPRVSREGRSSSAGLVSRCAGPGLHVSLRTGQTARDARLRHPSGRGRTRPH